MPQYLFSSQGLDQYLKTKGGDLENLARSAPRDDQLAKKVAVALRDALVEPLVFDRSKARFDTTPIADGGVSVKLKLPYSGDRGLLNCRTNGYVFERAGQPVHPNPWDEADKTVRVEFQKSFKSIDQNPIRAWAREVADDCDRQMNQQTAMVAAHNRRVKDLADRIIAEAEQRAGEADRLSEELGEGI